MVDGRSSREPGKRRDRFAFTNSGASPCRQALSELFERVDKFNASVELAVPTVNMIGKPSPV